MSSFEASLPRFEDIEVGVEAEIGSHTFSEQEIVDFASRFDPQHFHIDPVAARGSLLGGLCASGWHTACTWMRLNVVRLQQQAEGRPSGRVGAAIGPSPGFDNMTWKNPVYAGDTVTYRNRITARRELASRPGWGLVSFHAEGFNQRGQEVFSFDGAFLARRREA